jgi:4-aminobutyrate aminotransferase-like enzyme
VASIAVIEDEKLVERSAENGARALAHLRTLLSRAPGVREVRGRGLLLAVEFDRPERADSICARALRRGVIALPSGDDGRVLSITPPLSIEWQTLELALGVLADALDG